MSLIFKKKNCVFLCSSVVTEALALEILDNKQVCVVLWIDILHM